MAVANINIKRMSIEEFVDQGFLQEVNRRFLHLAGLALEVHVDDDGVHTLKGIWDYRDDEEGIGFAEGVCTQTKVDRVDKEMERHLDARIALWGSVVQPVEPTKR